MNELIKLLTFLQGNSDGDERYVKFSWQPASKDTGPMDILRVEYKKGLQWRQVPIRVARDGKCTAKRSIAIGQAIRALMAPDTSVLPGQLERDEHERQLGTNKSPPL